MSGTQDLQDKVSAVKTQMQHNLDSALKRGDELGHLQTTAETIDIESKHFQKTSVRVKRRQQCQHCKLWLLLAGIVGIILLVIILIVVIVAVVLSQ
uniref:V-SNARE coiled-coil homology domain-containing protein n=1 Tax=Amphimedon queenslandica TaxID=400682 RepID=A0A1X7UDA2_AMPQE